MVALLERLLAQPRPGVLAVDHLGHLQRDVEVPALNRQVEPRRLVLNKVKSNLRKRRAKDQLSDPLDPKSGARTSGKPFFWR